jgi:hypothetical protein
MTTGWGMDGLPTRSSSRAIACAISVAHSVTMTDEGQRALERVIATLRQQFPHVPAERVEQLVRQQHEQFVGRPIQEFVPVLIQRAVRDQLVHEPT